MSTGCALYSAVDNVDTLHQEERVRQILTAETGSSVDANGWSLPPTFRPAGDGAAAGMQAGAMHRPSIPIPVYCRPVTDDPSVQVTS